MTTLCIKAIKIYRNLFSPILLRHCRFHPSCSEYALSALEKYGFAKGSLKAVWRIIRCNPISSGGYDPA